MDEERFDQLYNRILDGENWDYSTLDELIGLAESGAREVGRKVMREKAIKARIKTCNCLCVVKESGKTEECQKCWHTRGFIDELDKQPS